jgi:hypothetical protein
MEHHPGKYYTKLAEENGLRVEMGRGDHAKVYGPAGRGVMPVPLHKCLATGTECKIAKWFRSLGILLTVFALVLALGAAFYYL